MLRHTGVPCTISRQTQIAALDRLDNFVDGEEANSALLDQELHLNVGASCVRGWARNVAVSVSARNEVSADSCCGKKGRR